MIISFDHKFIFFANGKTGTTSVVKALTPYNQNDQGQYTIKAANLFAPKHLPPSLMKAMLPAHVWDDCFKFTFVRNPYDWLVSQWFFNFRFRKNPRFFDDPGQWIRRRIHPYRKEMGRTHKELSNVKKFTVDDIDFLFQYLAANYRSLPYRKGKFQISYVLDAEDKMIIDYIGRFENLENDFYEIVNKIGLNDITLPKVNVSKHRSFEEYYTEESAQRVYDLWRQDFEVLGYDKL
ncbi:sulfotransferase family 2 domain-containing protein [Kaarinaea lacus]